MNRKRLALILAEVFVGSLFTFAGQNSKPNFSGTWVLDKEKSDLKGPPIDGDQTKGTGTGGSRGGGHSGGGGGRGMGGGGRRGGSGGGMGGTIPGSRGTSMPMKLDFDFYQISEASSQLTVEHADPVITLQLAPEAEGQASPEPLTYTADGKTHETSKSDGGWIKSKTTWEGPKLVTRVKETSKLGSMEIVEARSLSEDGNTFTVDLSYKGSSSHWVEKAVYRKEKNEAKPREKTQ
jgi:hypothetical protein